MDVTRPTSSTSGRWIALGLLALLATACGGEPCECRVADVVASIDTAPAPAAPVAVPETAPRVIGESPRAQLALETLDHLFARDFAPVRAVLTPELRDDLTDEKLASIMIGLVQAHGPPVQVMDAWTSTIREKEETMPAAQVLVKMANDTRLGLILVFNPEGVVKGLWLRPI